MPARSKRPVIHEWQKLRLKDEDLASHFTDKRGNVGVLLGEPSDWIVDVDIDNLEALAIAEGVLPPTRATWGRESKPRSHRLYRPPRPLKRRSGSRSRSE
ncbi:MAG: bifunctional DNA primase/polymerase [Phycisphaerales bacterium]|nr:bifunctional DNA primase/polymerase [Phycisphaerales bacterium]